MSEDKTIDNLLDLDGVRFVIDDHLGLWVKFEIKKIKGTTTRPQGIKYSLTLHDRSNNRILGFDNSHAIEQHGKKNISVKLKYDHWHRDSSDEGRPYHYENAAKLLEDFWREVDKRVERLREVKQ